MFEYFREPPYTQKRYNYLKKKKKNTALFWPTTSQVSCRFLWLRKCRTKLIDYRWLPFTYLLHRLNKLPRPTVPLLLFRGTLKRGNRRWNGSSRTSFVHLPVIPLQGNSLGCVVRNTRDLSTASKFNRLTCRRTKQRHVTIFQILK